MFICNGRVVSMESDPILCGFVEITDKKIGRIGPMEEFPGTPEDTVWDAGGGWILPGFVDAHTHLGLFEDALGFEGEDGNEDTDPILPQLRVIDGINPMERSFRESLCAGVTACLVSPGSCNPIGGQIAAIKTCGRRIDDMILRAPCAVKFALGENPKSCYNEKEESPVTRMATASLIRDTLMRAQEYKTRKQHAEDPSDAPDYDSKFEALVPVLDRSCQAHFHAHRADDIFTALRIAKEFQLDAVIIHGTEAHLVADILTEEPGIRICAGPCLTDRSKPELANLSEASPKLLTDAGIPTALITDHPETPLKHILHCALSAVKAGMEPMQALRAITIVPAEIAGIADRVGSIKTGKDADLVVFSGDPLEYRSTITAVFADGTCITGGTINAYN